MLWRCLVSLRRATKTTEEGLCNRGVDGRRICSAICGICWTHASREGEPARGCLGLGQTRMVTEWKLCCRDTQGPDAGGKWTEMGSAEDQEHANVSVQTGLAKAGVQRHSGTLLLPLGLSFSRAESEGVFQAECMKIYIPISFYLICFPPAVQHCELHGPNHFTKYIIFYHYFIL